MSIATKPMQSNKDKLVQLLTERRLHEAATTTAKQVERDIVALIEDQLTDDIRAVMRSKHGQAIDENHASRQFTELLQQFFVKVLNEFPEGLLKVETRTHLIRYIAKSLGNKLHTYFRDQNCHHSAHNEIAYLANLREEELQHDLPGACLQEVIQVITEWETSSNDEYHKWAAAIQFRFLVGMPNEQVDQQIKQEIRTFKALEEHFGISKSAAHRWCHNAIQALRSRLNVEH